MSDRFQEYFSYLRRRSWLGAVYRNWLLYPRLRKELRGRILDVGCGIGDFLAFETAAVGIDINPRLVEFCRQRGARAEVIGADGVFPYASAAFDSVLLDNVLEHIEEPYFLLSEIARVMVPGGRLLVGVPGHKGYNADPDHKTEYDKSQLVDTLQKAGFSCEHSFAMPLLDSEVLSNRLRMYCIYARFSRGS